MIEVLDRVRVPRPAGGHPRTRPDHVCGDKAYSSLRNRRYLRRLQIKHIIRADESEDQPPTARQPRRAADQLRQHYLQEEERRRALLQRAQGIQSRGDSLRHWWTVRSRPSTAPACDPSQQHLGRRAQQHDVIEQGIEPALVGLTAGHEEVALAVAAEPR
ncbi:transposase [Streptomyces sp. NPDC087437]|uniref:transposase n=1 Tax=Streptomyces sp. NPDC087437 TaxID=3365789 RepID=UPI0038066F2D